MKHIFMFSFILSSLASFNSFASDTGPRNPYEVLSKDILENRLGFSGNFAEIELPYGHVVNKVIVPWTVKGHYAQLVMEADYATIQKHLDKSTIGVEAVKVNGKAIVELYFLQYGNSSGGAYEETVVGIYTNAESKEIPEFKSVEEFMTNKGKYGRDIYSFQEHLVLGGPDEEFMNYQQAIWAGRVSISYPKFYGRTFINQYEAFKGYNIVIDQPEVAYFKKDEVDSKKAGKFFLETNLKVNKRPVNFAESMVELYFGAVTNNKEDICMVDDRLVVNTAKLDLNLAESSLRIKGNSSTALLLKKSNVQIVEASFGSDIQGFLYPAPVSDNKCRGAGGLPYNYKEFYPKRLTK